MKVDVDKYSSDFLTDADAFFDYLLEDVLPGDNDVKELRNQYEMGKKLAMGPMKSVFAVQYQNIVSPFLAQLIREDDGFFLQHSFSEYKESHDMGHLISRIKDIWIGLPHDKKQKIWGFIKKLYGIAVVVCDPDLTPNTIQIIRQLKKA